MNDDATNRPTNRPDAISRRRFIGVAAAAAGAGLCGRARGAEPTDRLVHDPNRPLSRVVEVRSTHVVRGTAVHATLLREILQTAMTSLTGKPTIHAAWHDILAPSDIIGLKFNRCGQETIGTTAPLAAALVESLGEAGWPADRIVFFEAPEGLAAFHGTRLARSGYSPEAVDFGSGSDQFASALEQITALINVPFLKTHNMTGLTCCLKNLSHGLVKHPARYHRNRCTPFVGDIVASAPIRDKLRLSLVDALRVVFDGGPDARAAGTGDAGIILASKDPVAADVVALQALNEVRAARRLPSVAESAQGIAHLAAAHRRGLGVAVPEGIELLRPVV